MLRLIAVAVGLSLGAATIPASAAPKNLARLEFVRDEGAESCADELALRNAVAERLGSDPFWPAAPLTVAVVMDKPASQLRARVLLRDSASQKLLGVRTLTSKDADCGELFAAMTLAVCIAIDPESALRAEAPPPEPEGPAAPPPASEPHDVVAARRVETPPARPPRAPSGHLEGRARFGLVAAVGTSPAFVAPGIGLAGGVRYGAWSLDLEGRADLPLAKDEPSATISASPLLLGATPCGHLDRFFGCVVGYGGVLRGESSTDPESKWTPLALVGPRIGAELPLASAYFLQIHAELLFPLTPTELVVDGETAWSLRLAGSLGLGAGARFR